MMLPDLSKEHELAEYVFSLSGQALKVIKCWQLQGFLYKMLVRDPAQRTSAAELLHHPFLRQAGHPVSLVPLMRQHLLQVNLRDG